MAAISVKRDSFFSRFKTPVSSQYLYHKLVEAGSKPRIRREKESAFELGEINISKWQKMDSRSLGITGKVPSPLYALIKILRSRGFEAYLVGGCVRDLLLNRTPKDYDVITTADLDQIKKQFHRCAIVGRRFPICLVHMKGSVFEVSSFKTLAKHSENKEKYLISKTPRGCDKSDLNLWKNSMHRDFTVNSLFFDPILHKIYDYNNGMRDLLELKLRTLVPAHESFTEDCARILRGIRIAARLGLSFSKDIESAIHRHASSMLTLSTHRIMMEMNYMLSFGAAESSLRILHRFHILEILLPFQAAYISRQTAGSGQCTMMLMKLFSHMDKFVSCDQPSTCCLWIGLLAFHQALMNKPQHPFVILTFGSVLYHQSWEDGLKFARKSGQPLVSFDPETSDPYKFISDDEVAKKVRELAMRVIDSLDILVDTDILHNTMSRFPGSPCSGLVFISRNSAHGTAQLFHVLSHKVETYNKGRNSFEMNHQLLGKGDASETRFALGKIIINTMGCGIDNHSAPPEIIHAMPSDSWLQKLKAKSSSSKRQNTDTEKTIEVLSTSLCPRMEGPTMEKPEEISASQSPPQKLSKSKKQNAPTEKTIEVLGTSSCPKIEVPTMEEPEDISSSQSPPHKLSNSKKQNAPTEKPIKDIAAKDQAIKKPEEICVSKSPIQELIATMETIIENEDISSHLEGQNPKEKVNVVAEVQLDQSTAKEESVDSKCKRKQVLPLSSFFNLKMCLCKVLGGKELSCYFCTSLTGMEAEHTVHLVRGFMPATSTPADGAPTRTNTTPPVAGEVGSVEAGTRGGMGLDGSPFPGLGLSGLGGNGGLFGAGLPELEQMQQQLTQNPNMMREIMDLPFVQNLLNNPDTMRNMMMNNPQMREIIDRNPELGHMLNDPAIIRQTMEAARNPELMREMMRNTDRAMSNIESSPEGFNMLRRMYENVQEPFLNAATMGGGGNTTNNLDSNPFASLLGGQGGPPRDQVANPTTTGADPATGSPAPNTNPLPNPWAAGGGRANQTNAAATNPGETGRSPPVGGLGGLGVPGLEGLFGGTTPDPSSMSQLMQNPAISQMMQGLLSNPESMNRVLGLNPQMRSMLDSNPQLREMMQNPDFIRQLTSPETMQQMMTLQQSLFSGIGQQQTPRDAGQTGGTGTPNNLNLDMLMNMFGGLGTGGFTAPNNSSVPPEELYATQLAQLQEMGFFDVRENLQALTATRGNVHAAVERLLGNLGQ
ncbi:hypothetical protein SSX86_010047 [Deinandra increscens subsp. villosa]|uniref:Ubiquilin n=1 Tax=Deinandra increscens subsp. villosa TaxID=3103831 RepID=A0AAP0DEI1_9ASTR